MIKKTRRAVTIAAGALLATIPLAGTFVEPLAAEAAEPVAWVVAQPSDKTYGPLLSATVADLTKWWSVTYPKLYGAPLPDGLSFHAGTPEAPPPTCGNPRRRSYRGVQGNAFYCGLGDYIAWDDAGLFPSMASRRGSAALAMVLAHEVGHAVQARAGVRLPSIFQELQADCFAGAWFAHVTSGDSALRLEDGDLDNAIAAVLGLRDRVGTDPRRGGAHGSGFDRVNALQLGYEEGAGRCARFTSEPPRFTAAAFTTAEEARAGGDVPLSDAVELVQKSLNEYWQSSKVAIGRVALATRESLVACGADASSAFADCNGTLLVSADLARTAHRQIGDLGVGAMLSHAWNARAGGTAMQAACRTGAWLSAADRRGLRLSPGDVDEAVIWTVLNGGAQGSFDRIRSFRVGFTSGACR